VTCLQKLQEAFAGAITRHAYGGAYRGVFPVKCNHDAHLVASIVQHGAPYGFGLEVGSKSELVMVMAVLATANKSHSAAAMAEGSLVICNGYKDSEYMELVLRARQLGINAIVVLEQASELDLILKASTNVGVPPVIGIRAKLSTRHEGHWGPTSGDKAKFGLRVPEIVAVVRALRARGMLGALQLLHFHCGSQITGISTVKGVMGEASQLYAELVKVR
jgi:arginine decarboxylase